MDEPEARAIAQAALTAFQRGPQRYRVVASLRETERAWLFSWQSADWLDTGRRELWIIGAVPIYVDKRTGRAHFISLPIGLDKAIQELEDTRKKLAEVENSRQADLVDQEKKMNERANAMLYSSSAREGASRKRMHEEVSQDDASKDTGGIWDAMFNSMRQQNGRY